METIPFRKQLSNIHMNVFINPNTCEIGIFTLFFLGLRKLAFKLCVITLTVTRYLPFHLPVNVLQRKGFEMYNGYVDIYLFLYLSRKVWISTHTANV